MSASGNQGKLRDKHKLQDRLVLCEGETKSGDPRLISDFFLNKAKLELSEVDQSYYPPSASGESSPRGPVSSFTLEEFFEFYEVAVEKDRKYLASEEKSRGRVPELRRLFSWMENAHHYIQYFFPLIAPTPHNKTAPLLQPKTLALFRGEQEDQKAGGIPRPLTLQQANLIKLLKIMLHFMGLTLKEGEGGESEIVIEALKEPLEHWKGCSFSDYFDNVGNGHNYKRFSRMVQSLVTLGLENYALALFKCLIKLYPNPDKERRAEFLCLALIAPERMGLNFDFRRNQFVKDNFGRKEGNWAMTEAHCAWILTVKQAFEKIDNTLTRIFEDDKENNFHWAAIEEGIAQAAVPPAPPPEPPKSPEPPPPPARSAAPASQAAIASPPKPTEKKGEPPKPKVAQKAGAKEGEDPAYQQRIAILKDTLEKLSSPAKRKACKQQAESNHTRWAAERKEEKSVERIVQVVEGDWGAVTSQLSKRTGKVYAVLNMANASKPGGGYWTGKAAQEENMFRRTDCHFSISDAEEKKRHYNKENRSLINGEKGLVYLDVTRPRICIKGPEEFKEGVVNGYQDLKPEDYFLFIELRSAADDLRERKLFDEKSMRRKIRAQLNTLKQNGIRDVVLSAFGCGAFGNPPEKVAQLYKEELEKMPGCFDEVVFAIYFAGSGEDNFKVFKGILDGASLKSASLTTPIPSTQLPGSHDPQPPFSHSHSQAGEGNFLEPNRGEGISLNARLIKFLAFVMAAGLLELIASGVIAWVTHATVLGISAAMGPSIVGFAALVLLMMGVVYCAHKMGSEKSYGVAEPAAKFEPRESAGGRPFANTHEYVPVAKGLPQGNPQLTPPPAATRCL